MPKAQAKAKGREQQFVDGLHGREAAPGAIFLLLAGLAHGQQVRALQVRHRPFGATRMQACEAHQVVQCQRQKTRGRRHAAAERRHVREL
ncbi:hypothetical protein D9M70_476630 [compost metagenome]